MNAVFLILFSVSAALLLARDPAAFLPALLGGAGKAVTLGLTLAAVYAVWLGFLRVAQDAGLVRGLARGVRPLTARLFATRDAAALDAAAVNLAANFLGMGSAATPAGIAAMRRLGRTEGADYAQAMLFAVNCAGVQLLPTTALAVRMAAGSAQPYDIVLPALLASLTALLTGAALTRLFFRPPFSARGRAAGRSGRGRANERGRTNERGREHRSSPPPTEQNGRRHSPSPPPTEQNGRGGAR